MLMIAQSCEYTKGHRILYFKNVNFTVYGLYFNFLKYILKSSEEESSSK